MTRDQARAVLDGVRNGHDYSLRTINQALEALGDVPGDAAEEQRPWVLPSQLQRDEPAEV